MVGIRFLPLGPMRHRVEDERPVAGGDMEVNEARRLGIPVVHSQHELLSRFPQPKNEGHK